MTPLRRHRDFRVVVAGQAISSLGSAITYVAVPYQVYVLTRSPLLTGLIGLVELAPTLAFGLVAGVLADRYDRRRLLLVGEGALCLVALAYFANSRLAHPSLAVIYVLAALAAAFLAVQRTALVSSIPRLVTSDLLAAASATEMVYYSVAQIAGPAIAGFLIAVGGLGAAYTVDAVSFVGAVGAAWLMAPLPPLAEGASMSVSSIVEGFRFVARSPAVLAAQLIDLDAMLLGLPTALFPAIGLGRFGGPQAVGLLYSAVAAGGLLGGVLSGPVGRVRRQGRGLLLAVLVWGAAIALFGLSPWLVPAVVLLATAGAADSVSGIFRTAMVQSITPDALRGRMTGVAMCFYTTGPLLGQVEAGAVASLFGVTASVVSGGLGSIAGALLIAWRWRDLLAYERPGPD